MDSDEFRGKWWHKMRQQGVLPEKAIDRALDKLCTLRDVLLKSDFKTFTLDDVKSITLIPKKDLKGIELDYESVWEYVKKIKERTMIQIENLRYEEDKMRRSQQKYAYILREQERCVVRIYCMNYFLNFKHERAMEEVEEVERPKLPKQDVYEVGNGFIRVVK